MNAKTRTLWVLLSAATLITAFACSSGTWNDDSGNFKRVFGFTKPNDVQVIHSYYWKSPHWTTEYRYFVAMKAAQKFTSALTSAELMKSVPPSDVDVTGCGSERPSWFLPKSLTDYEMWVPKSAEPSHFTYRVFRDKADGTLFVCDQRL